MPAMMESTMMRSPHWRWRSVTKPRTTPNPVVPIVVITRISWAVNVVVIPIGIRWDCGCCCHHGSWRNNWGRYHNRSRSHIGWTRRKHAPNQPASESTPESRVMMAERHDAEAQCKCHNSHFLVHVFILRLEVCLPISIYIIQHTLRYVKTLNPIASSHFC